MFAHTWIRKNTECFAVYVCFGVLTWAWDKRRENEAQEQRNGGSSHDSNWIPDWRYKVKISQHHLHLFCFGTERAGFETPKNSIQFVSSVFYFASVGAHFIIFSVLARGYSGNWKKPFVSRWNICRKLLMVSSNLSLITTNAFLWWTTKESPKIVLWNRAAKQHGAVYHF